MSRRRCVQVSTIFASGLAGCVVSLAGCGGGRGDLAPVRGTVRLDGQPLAGAQVQFAPQDGKGVVSLGRTDASGNYEMMATRIDMGASRGLNHVRITTFEIEDYGAHGFLRFVCLTFAREARTRPIIAQRGVIPSPPSVPGECDVDG